MRKFQLLVMAFLMTISAFSQSIKPNKETIEDYLPLLQACGYKAYSFDISEFLNDTYQITFKVNEYVDSVGIVNTSTTTFANRKMISDFPVDVQQRILKEGTALAPEKNIYAQSDKIIVGFSPTKADSIKTLYLTVEGRGAMRSSLNLKGLMDPYTNQSIYIYESRPFKIDKFEESKFVPLVLFGSFWLDKEYGYFRFCGENEMEPDMSTNLIKFLPHYYVIGVEINKVK